MFEIFLRQRHISKHSYALQVYTQRTQLQLFIRFASVCISLYAVCTRIYIIAIHTTDTTHPPKHQHAYPSDENAHVLVLLPRVPATSQAHNTIIDDGPSRRLACLRTIRADTGSRRFRLFALTKLEEFVLEAAAHVVRCFTQFTGGVDAPKQRERIQSSQPKQDNVWYMCGLVHTIRKNSFFGAT